MVNIGWMIKQLFSHSQFIIVTHKEGMFNNSNVLFRVRFDLGSSVVTRITQAGLNDQDDVAANEGSAVAETQSKKRRRGSI